MVNLREKWGAVKIKKMNSGETHFYNVGIDARASQHTAWELVAVVGRISVPKTSTSEC